VSEGTTAKKPGKAKHFVKLCKGDAAHCVAIAFSSRLLKDVKMTMPAVSSWTPELVPSRAAARSDNTVRSLNFSFCLKKQSHSQTDCENLSSRIDKQAGTSPSGKYVCAKDPLQADSMAPTNVSTCQNKRLD